MTMLVAIDGSPSSDQALKQACDLARASGGKLTVLCVSQVLNLAWYGPFIPGNESVLEVPDAQEASSILKAALATCQERGVTALSRYVVGSPAEEILKAADDLQADMIVVGSHGRTGLERFMMGSVSSQVVAHATCSVLLARLPKHAPARNEAPAVNAPA